MDDTPGEGASMQVSVGGKKYLFCSEAPDNRKRSLDFLLNTIEKFITCSTQEATIFGFVSSIDSKNAKINSDLTNIDRKLSGKDINISIHTNTEKHSTFLDNKSGKLRINYKPEQRTGPNRENIECALYAICPHGSVATAALHFIAQHIDEKSLHIEPQHVFLRALVIPFLPLRFGYPAISKHESNQECRERFLEVYSITDTSLAEKIDVRKRPICRSLYGSKYNLFCSDVRYAKQIETKDLIEKTHNGKKFLKILKMLYNSIDKFNLWPKSFVLIEKVKEYKSYKKCNDSDKIALPIIDLKNQLLICSSTDFFGKQSQTSARLLWSLAVGWNPPLSLGNNPYEYPYRKWIKSIVEIDRDTLNEEFGPNTWEHFLRIILLDAGERAWFWYTVSRWCDVIEDAFNLEGNLSCFVEFLKKRKKSATKFINLLSNSDRYRIGNKWQTEIIKQRKAHQYLEKIRKSLVGESENDDL